MSVVRVYGMGEWTSEILSECGLRKCEWGYPLSYQDNFILCIVKVFVPPISRQEALLACFHCSCL